MPDDSRPDRETPDSVRIPDGFGQTGAAPGRPGDEAREAMDRLNETNRVLTEARMPRGYKLTDEQSAEVAARFKRFLAEQDISARHAARGCDYSEAVLSDWMAGKYTGNRSAVAHAANDWMEKEARRRSAAGPQDYVSTQVAQDLRTITYAADKRCMMAAIVAPAGCGKTFILKALTEEMRGIYIYCTDGMTATNLYRALAEALGWGGSGHRTRDDLRRFIVVKLAGSSRPIFLDEAHRLGKHVGAIRSIHDEARVAVVMAGTDEILRFVDDRAHGRGQFSRRCIRYNALEVLYDADRPDGGQSGRNLFSVEEVRAFFDMKKIRLADDDALMLLWGMACAVNHGTLGLAEKVAEQAVEFSQADGAAVAAGTGVTRRHILYALRMIVGGDGVKHLERLAGRYVARAGGVAAVAAAG